ncbi:VOC family protein [Bacillus ndiopicus]|uniref:VOC family protein n=1 Tax=Bacillus ndiopicus TaxID=1347368 RepID=UPI0005A61F82|nr:VOC family protein [Bacillus ndiopicus]
MTTNFHKKPNMYTSHVQLKVSNLQRSLEYYTTIIGFKVLQQDEKNAYLTVDGTTSFLSLIEVDNALPLREGLTGLYHIALLLPTRKDLGNIVQHFVQHNIRLGAADHHVSEALYLNDPDGNGIEIYFDRPAVDWQWHADNVTMFTEQLNFNPILAEADGQWNGLPQDTIIGHIHLSVADLAQTEQFYTNVLDYNIVARYGHQALFISTGNYHHHIGLNTWHSANGSKPSQNHVGLQSFTIVLENVEIAQQVREKLTTAGFTVEHFVDAPSFGGAQIFSVEDPNGIRILFTVDGE